MHRRAHSPCSRLALLAAAVLATLGAPTGPAPARATERRDADAVTLDGYAEWRSGDVVVVDGQRVRAAAGARIRRSGKPVASLAAIPLGDEAKVHGTRQP